MNICKLSSVLANVPQPPGESLPSGASDAELNSFSDRTGIVLPNEFRQWLKFTNGACVGPGGLFGIRTALPFLDIETYFGMYPSWREKKWLPIAGDGCGNYYVIATQSEYGVGYPVLFIETFASSDLPAYIVASDLEHFLHFLFEKEIGNRTWPFDERTVTKKDPAILNFANVSLPWEPEKPVIL